jgi:glycosyltransferase involved in cell wall biosynthesis
VIAAGSHWARSVAGVRNQPSNIRYVSEVLSFAELRDLYERASLLVVPLQDVPNQSGVTAILEAMSMGLPVIVTATEGQRELVSGPIVGTAGQRSASATADRGPWLLRGSAPAEAARPNGLYVPPGDAHALTHAMRQLLEDDLQREAMGRVGRCYAEEFFETDNYVASLAAELTGDHQP